jgi:hypothetical protein
VAGATPCPEMGWPDHPIFGQGVAEPAVWGWPKPPRPLGVVRPPRKAKKKKKKKKNEKMGLGFWGWPDHPQGPGGGFGHPLRPVGGVPSHPQALGGGPATPKGQNPFFPFFFFFFWPFGVAGPPPKAWGGFGHPHTAGSATPWPKMGWSGHPISGQGVAPATPRFPLFFFFFFFFDSFFFSKKKNPKICKTTPFCPKRRSFGVEGIMGIYIFLYTHYTLEGS